MADLFGTDGVRGVANVGAMSPETAMAMGRAAAQVLTSRGHGAESPFVVGRDTRVSGTMPISGPETNGVKDPRQVRDKNRYR